MTDHKFYDIDIEKCEFDPFWTVENVIEMHLYPSCNTLLLNKDDIIYLASLFGLVVSEGEK